MTDKCFACGKKLGKSPALVDTRDDQLVFVGRECFKLIAEAGEGGYMPKSGTRLFFPIPQAALEVHNSRVNP